MATYTVTTWDELYTRFTTANDGDTILLGAASFQPLVGDTDEDLITNNGVNVALASGIASCTIDLRRVGGGDNQDSLIQYKTNGSNISFTWTGPITVEHSATGSDLFLLWASNGNITATIRNVTCDAGDQNNFVVLTNNSNTATVNYYSCTSTNAVNEDGFYFYLENDGGWGGPFTVNMYNCISHDNADGGVSSQGNAAAGSVASVVEIEGGSFYDNGADIKTAAGPGGILNISDATITSSANAAAIAYVDFTGTLSNCSIESSANVDGLYSLFTVNTGTGTITVENCDFVQSGGDAVNGTKSLLFAVGDDDNTTTKTVTFTDCTFAYTSTHANPDNNNYFFFVMVAATVNLYRCKFNWLSLPSMGDSVAINYGTLNIRGCEFKISALLATTLCILFDDALGSGGTGRISHNTFYVVASPTYGVIRLFDVLCSAVIRANIFYSPAASVVRALRFAAAAQYDDETLSGYNVFYNCGANPILGASEKPTDDKGNDPQFISAPNNLRRSSETAPNAFADPSIDYQIAYTITENTTGNGDIIRNPSYTAGDPEPIAYGRSGIDVGAYVHTGSQVELIADPEEDALFDSWSGSLSSTINPLIVTMTQDWNLIANFVSPVPNTAKPSIYYENPIVSDTGTPISETTTLYANSSFPAVPVTYEIRNGITKELYARVSSEEGTSELIREVNRIRLRIILPFRSYFEFRVYDYQWSEWLGFWTRDKTYKTPNAASPGRATFENTGQGAIVEVAENPSFTETQTSRGARVDQRTQHFVDVQSVRTTHRGVTIVTRNPL